MSISRKIKDLFLAYSRQRVASGLMQLPDNQLSDIGVSRDLLRQGAKAFPWRENNTVAEVIAMPRMGSQQRASAAMQELKADKLAA